MTRTELALEKARLKPVLRKAMETLPKDARIDLLADLLVEEDEIQEEKSPIRDPRANGARHAEHAKPVQTTLPIKTPSKTEQIFGALKARPGTSIQDLTTLVYPEEPDATHRVRAILFSLKRQGRAKNPHAGKWEVVE